jgi:hypothetical protein
MPFEYADPPRTTPGGPVERNWMIMVASVAGGVILLAFCGVVIYCLLPKRTHFENCMMHDVRSNGVKTSNEASGSWGTRGGRESIRREVLEDLISLQADLIIGKRNVGSGELNRRSTHERIRR